MMKKLIAALLTSCMVIAPVCVMAETAETSETSETSAASEAAEVMELNWADVAGVEEAKELIDSGEFVVFDEIACKFWVPSVLEAQELTDEDTEEGYIGYFTTEEEDAVASVMLVDVDGMTLEEYKAELEGMDDVSGVADAVINGMECVGYDVEDDDVTCVAFATESGSILEFTFYPASDEDFSSVAAVMMASIMPEDGEETA